MRLLVGLSVLLVGCTRVWSAGLARVGSEAADLVGRGRHIAGRSRASTPVGLLGRVRFRVDRV